VDRTLKLTSISRKTFSPNGDGRHDAVTLSFRLSRPADVAVTVVRSGSTVRTMPLGPLAKGTHTVDWDGALSGGAVAKSGRYGLKVVADGAVGVTSVAQALTVDLAAPKVTAPATASVAYRRKARLAYVARDAFSALVKVSATITNARGRVVATVSCGWVKQGVRHACAWKPRARGRYTVTFRAMDLGGNRQKTTAITSLRVR